MPSPPPSLPSSRLYVRCECRKILAHRIHTGDGWVLELKYGKRIPIITSAYPLIVTCSGKNCDMTHRMTPAEGITETIREQDGRVIPTRDAGSQNSGTFAATG